MIDPKILDKLIKIKRQADSAYAIESYGEAENFNEYLKTQLTKHNLTLNDLESSINSADNRVNTINIINEVGKTIVVNPFLRVNAKTEVRMKWFEDLASLIGKHYGCITNVRTKTGEISFYGFNLDRELGSFMFLKVADMAHNNAKTEIKRLKPLINGINPFKKQQNNEIKEWMGDDIFEFSFHSGFRKAVEEIYIKNDREIDPLVRNYFEVNKNTDITRNNYYEYYYPRDNEEKKLKINDFIFDLGRRYGHNSITKSQTTNNLTSGSQLVSTRVPTIYNNIIDNDNKVLILLDVSYSMYGNNIEQAKEGCINFAKETVNKGDVQIGVITFSTNIKYVIKFTKNIDEKFEKRINKIDVEANTYLKEAIQMAVCYFTNNRVKKTICIITDGLPEDRIGAIIAAKEAKRMGIKIMAIGTDVANQEFLDELCSEDGLGVLVSRERLALGIGEMANKL